MNEQIKAPSLNISFEAAARTVTNRGKRGVVAVLVRDTKNTGVTVMTSEKDIPTALGETNRQYLARAFRGSDRGVPSRVIAAVIAPEGTDTLAKGLQALSTYSVDYLAAPADVTEEECQKICTWVDERREAYGTVKAVLPHMAADSMGVINFDTDGIQVGETSYTAGEYASRIAGVLAGIPSEGSATYVVLPEVTGVPVQTEEQVNAAIAAGKLVLVHDGVKAKLSRAVNSLVTVPDGGSGDWRKIKLVEGMDLIRAFLRSTVEDSYLGRYANTYDNKCLLLTAINDYFAALEGAGVLQQGQSWAEIDVDAQRNWLKEQNTDVSGMDEQAVKEAGTGSWVFIRCGGRLMDAMEDFSVRFTNL